MKRSSSYVTRSALIGAIYALLSIILRPISFGAIQFRVSEALTLLPVVFPESIVGLTVGCAIANLTSPYGLLDIVVGSVATLTSGVFTRLLKKHVYLAPLPVIFINALLIPLVVTTSATFSAYLLYALYVAVSEAVITYLLGIPLLKLVDKFGKQ